MKNKGPLNINVLGADDVDTKTSKHALPLFTEEEIESFDTSVASSRKPSKILG